MGQLQPEGSRLAPQQGQELLTDLSTATLTPVGQDTLSDLRGAPHEGGSSLLQVTAVALPDVVAERLEAVRDGRDTIGPNDKGSIVAVAVGALNQFAHHVGQEPVDLPDTTISRFSMSFDENAEALLRAVQERGVVMKDGSVGFAEPEVPLPEGARRLEQTGVVDSQTVTFLESALAAGYSVIPDMPQPTASSELTPSSLGNPQERDPQLDSPQLPQQQPIPVSEPQQDIPQIATASAGFLPTTLELPESLRAKIFNLPAQEQRLQLIREGSGHLTEGSMGGAVTLLREQFNQAHQALGLEPVSLPTDPSQLMNERFDEEMVNFTNELKSRTAVNIETGEVVVLSDPNQELGDEFARLEPDGRFDSTAAYVLDSLRGTQPDYESVRALFERAAIQSNGLEMSVEEMFRGGARNSVIGYLLGNAEGNINLNGNVTSSWNNHGDPGNSATNYGVYSVNSAFHPSRDGNSADAYFHPRLQGVAEAIAPVMEQAGLNPRNSLVMATYLSLYLQSPRQAESGLVPQFGWIAEQGGTPEVLREALHRAALNDPSNPNSGIISGWWTRRYNNPVERHEQDQSRRFDAIFEGYQRVLDGRISF